MKTNDQFPNLVSNAFDFLEKSIASFDSDIKSSVINFYSSIELFLKARLLKEHWSLVVSKREPDLDAFLRGDFVSVTLDESLTRLDKVVKSPVDRSAADIFKILGAHRNRMVHFFHEASTKKAKNTQHQRIAKEQLTGWFFLRSIIADQWRDQFSGYEKNISEIDKKFRKHKDFLKIVFGNLKAEISGKEALGWKFLTCKSCGFKSLAHSEDVFVPNSSACLVCGVNSLTLEVKCADCSRSIFMIDELDAICKCGLELEENEVVDCIEDAADSYEAMKNGESIGRGNCSDCDGSHSVILLKNERYLCIDCKGLFDQLSVCDWCNEPNTGDMTDSFLSGCNFCDGRLGWKTDD